MVLAKIWVKIKLSLVRQTKQRTGSSYIITNLIIPALLVSILIHSTEWPHDGLILFGSRVQYCAELLVIVEETPVF
uniref:Putative ovule protein n=1 Tax=Solanum chacoense TaxID=4108 RepID=A0A0V0HR85_SOLCH